MLNSGRFLIFLICFLIVAACSREKSEAVREKKGVSDGMPDKFLNPNGGIVNYELAKSFELGGMLPFYIEGPKQIYNIDIYRIEILKVLVDGVEIPRGEPYSISIEGDTRDSRELIGGYCCMTMLFEYISSGKEVGQIDYSKAVLKNFDPVDPAMNCAFEFNYQEVKDKIEIYYRPRSPKNDMKYATQLIVIK